LLLLTAQMLFTQATTTPSNDDNSIIEHSTTALEGKTGTAAQNAKSAQELTAAANSISAAAGVKVPRSAAPTPAAPTATFAPSNDDSSSIENTVTFLNSGKGSPEAKQAARNAFTQAGNRLGSPESMKQVLTLLILAPLLAVLHSSPFE
jgi:hypothetical protein